MVDREPAAQDHPLGLRNVAATRSFRVSADGVSIDASPSHAATTIAECGVVAFGDVLEAKFREMILRYCRKAEFAEERLGSIGWRIVERPDLVGAALRMALARPQLLRWLEEATGCGPLHEIDGALARTVPGTTQELAWHDDRNDPRRRLAVVLHLTEQPYDGGELEFRQRDTQQVVARIEPPPLGCLVLFPVTDAIQHRVRPVAAGADRQVFAGWYLAT